MLFTRHQCRWSLTVVTVSVTVFIFSLKNAETLETVLTPRRCICPSDGYNCEVKLGTEIEWIANDTDRDELDYSLFNIDDEETQIVESFRAYFDDLDNYTSTLFVTNIRMNETNLTCRGAIFDRRDLVESNNDTISVCLVGPASPPTILSLVWNSSSVELSFQSPVYGGECVEYYVVTAVSEEEERKCNATSGEDSHSCSISLQGNANDYNFTVHAVTRVNDSFVFIGNSTTDCCLPFPENVRAVEEECGHVNVSWERGDMMSVNTTISWRGRGGATGYERAGSGDSHLLTLDYSETGPVEIAVTFSSSVCNKTTITHYNVEKVLKDISQSSTTLIIESRDCTANPENYRIVVSSTDTPYTELLNVSFSPTIQHDVGGLVAPGSQYTVRVQLIEITSDTVIDERNYTLVNTTTTADPGDGVSVTDAVQPATDGADQTIYIAVGVGVTVGILLVLITGVLTTVIVMLTVIRKKNGKAVKGSPERDTELSAVNATVQEPQSPPVVYETVSGVVVGTSDPDTSDNVAYVVSETVSTTNNPAYGHLQMKK